MSTKRKPASVSGACRHGQEVDGGRLCSSDPHITPARAGRQVLYHGNKVVAVIQHGTLTKTVDGWQHYLHNPPALALDLDAVNTAEAQGVPTIVIDDSVTGDVYSCTLAELRAFGWEFERSGYGRQIAMRLERWHKNGNPPANINAPKLTVRTAPQPQQLALW